MKYLVLAQPLTELLDDRQSSAECLSFHWYQVPPEKSVAVLLNEILGEEQRYFYRAGTSLHGILRLCDPGQVDGDDLFLYSQSRFTGCVKKKWQETAPFSIASTKTIEDFFQLHIFSDQKFYRIGECAPRAKGISIVKTDPRSCVIIGSFRKHYDAITLVIEEATKSDIKVLSPSTGPVIDLEEEFVHLIRDPKDYPEDDIENIVLMKMHEAAFIYWVNPDGYSGISASFELGYAVAHGIPVFSSSDVRDPLLVRYVKKAPLTLCVPC